MGRDWTRTRVSGPLVPHVAGFAADLAERGYSEWTIPILVRRLAMLSGWLEKRGLAAGMLSPALLAEFVRAGRRRGWRTRSARAYAPLLRYLRSIGVLAEPQAAQPVTAADVLLDSYRTHLVRERGLPEKTAVRYAATARAVLASRGGSVESQADLMSLTAGEVSKLVSAECRRRSPGSARHWVAEVRSLLRFLEMEGLSQGRLLQAIPSVAHWRDTTLPRSLSRGQVDRMLGGCNRNTVAGARDFAVITMLARLGLRSLEVVRLQLEDIDWRRGEVVVQAKGRCERLPLPADVGEALSEYLHRRPRIQSRHLFLTVVAPIEGLQPNSLSFIVRRACWKAGLPPCGAHQLRHTAATEMLRQGASLEEIGQVLRHQSPSTTAIYARVDRDSLRELAQAWPGAMLWGS